MASRKRVHEEKAPATCKKKEKLQKPRKRCSFALDIDDTPGMIGRFTCLYGQCIYSNYVFGFETREERNKHMAECIYGDGNVHPHIPSDGKMPSAQMIDDLVDGFAVDASFKNMLQSYFLKPVEQGFSGFSSLNTVVPPQVTNPIALIITKNAENGTLHFKTPSEAGLGSSRPFLAEHYPIQSRRLENKTAKFYGESSGGYLTTEKYPKGERGTLENNWFQIINGTPIRSYEGFTGHSGHRYHSSERRSVLLENTNVIASSGGQLLNKDYSTLTESNWSVKYNEELGQLMSGESISSKRGGALENNKGILSSASRPEQYLRNNGTEGNAAFDYLGIMNTNKNNCEVPKNDIQLQDEALDQEGFLHNFKVEFLDGERYLMEDDPFACII